MSLELPIDHFQSWFCKTFDPRRLYILILIAILAGLTIGFLAGFSAKLCLGVAITFVLLAIIYPQPKRGLVIIMALLPFEYIAAYSDSLTLIKVVGVITFISWIRGIISGRSVNFDLAGTSNISLFLFLSFAVLSILASSNFGIAVSSLSTMVLLIGLYFLASDIGTDPRFLQLLLKVLVISATISALLGLYRFFFLGSERAASASLDPNFSALILACVIPFVLFAFNVYQSSNSRHILLLFLLVLISAVIVTFSRGAFVTLAVMMVAYLVMKRLKKVVLPALVSLAGIIYMLAPQSFWDRMAEFASSNWAGRTELLIVSQNMISDHWILGVGLGNYKDNFLAYAAQVPMILPWHLKPLVAHNLFLQVTAETGIFGVCAFIVFIGSILWRLRNSWRAQSEQQRRIDNTLSQAIFLSLITFLTGSLFLSTQNLKIFWLLLGLGIAACSRANCKGVDAVKA